MKKFLSIVIYIAIGIGFGFFIVALGGGLTKGFMSTGRIFFEIVAMLVAVSLAAILQIILHEAGHLVCGLLSGYRFVSFRVGSFTLIKDKEGKFRFKRFKLAGTGGQCLMSPPTDDLSDNIPTVLYNAGGVLMNLLCATLVLVVILFCNYFGVFFQNFLAAMVVMGYAFALLNGIPMKLGGIANDGYNILYLNRDKQAVKGFAAQLIVNEKLQNGMRLSEMPDEVFDLGGEINYSDPLQANVALMFISRELDKGNVEAAHEQFKELLNNHRKELMPLLKLEAGCELAFTSLATGDKEVARNTFNDELLMKYITKYARVMSSKQRVLMAKALLFDGDRAEAERLYNEVVASRDKYLMQGEVESDIEQMKRLLAQ